jgi:PAS domain S-box-containing protein
MSGSNNNSLVCASDASRLQANLDRAREEYGAQIDALKRDLAELAERCQTAQAGMAYYRELFEFAPDCYLTTDLAGNIREVNHTATMVFGRPREFLTGKPLPFLAVPDCRANLYGLLVKLNSSPESIQGAEARLQGLRGRWWDASLTVTVVSGPDGRPAELRWLLRDITAAQAAEQELRVEKAFVERLIDTAQTAVLLVGTDGEILRMNRYLLTLTGYRREELIGKDWCILLAETERETARAEFRDILRGVDALPTVQRARTRDGPLRTIAWSGTRVPDLRPEHVSVLLVGQDITELEAAQRQAVQFERLAAIGQMAAGLAHESRNALQRGAACLERLKWALQGQPHALDLVARARQAQDDLLHLYEDVREYATVIRLEWERADVAETWREAWTQVLAVCHSRDVRLEELPVTADPCCVVDRFRLIQVFRNLFDNALHACPDPVRILVRGEDAQLDGRPALRVVVRDNGPGLDAEQRQRLFEPFYTTKTRGTGLGLAIVKRLVEAHGGEIAASDRPPPGAEIIVTLPRSQP